MLHPELAPPGTVVRIVAPSGPFEEEVLRRGLSHLHDYEIHLEPELIGRQSGFLAGDDQQRLSELQGAMDASEARVI